MDSKYWVIITVTLCFLVLDIASGLAKAWYLNDIKSKALREGLFHKLAFVGAIALAGLIEWTALATPEIELNNVPIVTVVCIYIIGTEAVSIIENLKAINPQIGGLAKHLAIHKGIESQEKLDLAEKEEPDEVIK